MGVAKAHMAATLLSVHNDAAQTLGELAIYKLKISEFKSIVENMFAPHCPSGLAALQFRVPCPILKVVGRFERLSFPSAAQFKHFSVLTRQSYGLTFQ